MARKKTELELEAHWRSVVEDFVASDFRVGQYCQERKMSKASLYSWSRRLGIPLKKGETFASAGQTRKDGKQGNFENEESPFSFIELNIPPPPVDSASCPVKLELLLGRGRMLKIEAAPSWEGLIGMIKALVS